MRLAVVAITVMSLLAVSENKALAQLVPQVPQAALSVQPLPVERLDESSIRSMYAANDKLVYDPQLTIDLLRVRLSDDFTLNSDDSFYVQGNLQHQNKGAMNKAEIIGDAVMHMNDMKLLNMDHKIVDIHFSDDGKLAYVRDTSVSTGIVRLPVGNGQTMDAHFEQNQAGIDTLALSNQHLLLVHTDRRSEINILR